MSKESSVNGNGSDWKSTKVSMVADAWGTQTSDNTVADILDAIRSGKWAGEVQAITATYTSALEAAQREGNADPVAEAKKAVDAAKKKLPGVLFSGTFSRRADDAIEQHSGILCVDMDNCAAPAELRVKLATDKHVLFALISPTGSGPKVGVRIKADASLHRASYAAVKKHFSETYRVTFKVDDQCINESRICFVSYDPDMFIRDENAEVLEPLEGEETEENSNTAESDTSNQIDDQRDADLRDEVGEPIVVNRNGAIRINQTYFIYRFALEHKIRFETLEQAFHLYDDATGAWKYSDPGNIKKLFREDWLRLAPVFGGPSLLAMGTDVLFNHFVNGLRSHVGAADIFKRLPRGLIHVGNGMLQLHANGEHELLPFSPDYYSRNPIPINYNPAAQCPRFIQLLADQLKDEDISLVQRWMGSCLLQGNAAQRLMLFTGTGGSSKTTVVNCTVKLLGRHNTGALRTKQLEGRFEIGRLQGKTFLTACDVSGTFLQHPSAAVIKALTGDDFVPGEAKGVMRPVDIDGDFGMAITCNETLLVLLHGENDVKAWRRRLLLVDFPKAVAEEKRVDKYADLLIAEEGEGILAYAVAGAVAHLGELKARGDFILSTEQKGRVDKLLLESQSLRFFVKDQITPKEGADLTTGEIVSAYFSFCKKHGWGTRPMQTVERELKDLMLEIHNSHASNHLVREDDRRIRGYTNVALCPEDDANGAQ